MTRGSAIDFPNVLKAAERCKAWIDSAEGFDTVTGDPMGMNMIPNGTEKALEALQKHIPDITILALLGNYCTNKKPAAINCIEGRGGMSLLKLWIGKKCVEDYGRGLGESEHEEEFGGGVRWRGVLGVDAHAANIFTEVFLATGQDPAQNVESSHCMMLIEGTNSQDLITITITSIEIGTVGTGTVLAP
ncbi:nad-binding domain of hmg-CoA reductase [Gymnopus androsaceus JB14]|uniref:Nad-binding domain of hmg-CoA reductase n=1 Tax=Gymnopus androsaceus JB14 TaxID=1447944 RepID=A0A6A4HML2_9AGAR|nr:nad-binding domain of hmg-CoA reductase [Gymnopus androsaceus JB14]